MHVKSYLPSYLFADGDGKVRKVLAFDVKQNDGSTIVSYHMRRDSGKPVYNVSGCLCLPGETIEDRYVFWAVMDFRRQIIEELRQFPR